MYEAGDTITLTVKAVDPETGEVEAVCDPKSKPPEGSPSEMGIEDLEE